MYALNADQWTMEVPQDGKSFAVELPPQDTPVTVDFEVRCQDGCVVNAVTPNGELVFIGSGSIVSFAGKMSGFAALDFECASTFSYRCSLRRGRWLDVIDPTPVSVVKVDKGDPLKSMVRDELRKMMGKAAARGWLSDDAQLDELLKDFQDGDLEFEDEPDSEFGGGFLEPEEDFVAASAPVADPPKPKAKAPAPARRSGAPNAGEGAPAQEADADADDVHSST